MRSLLTRDQAIVIAGAEAVARADAENCECTNIVGYNGACQGDDLTEWATSTDIIIDGDDATIRAYYYTTNDQDRTISYAGGDGAAIDWEIAGYEIF